MGSEMSRQNYENGSGLRVLKVLPESPCFKAGIEPFLDFIISIIVDNREIKFISIDSLDEKETLNYFFKIVSENQNKLIGMTIFNIYFQKQREIQITPTRNWPNSESLLGIFVRKEEFTSALSRTFKVLKVLENSPAASSGLIELEDYVLGLSYFKYRNVSEFKNILNSPVPLDSQENLKEVCVFNNKSRKIRFVVLKPKKEWGGHGILGCEFGYGSVNNLQAGLEDIKSFENNDKKSNSPLKEKSILNSANKIKQNNKLKIPPKNPFKNSELLKKPSFEKVLLQKDGNEKDFIEVSFLGIPRYENPCTNNKSFSKIDKKEDFLKLFENSDIKSTNSSFLLSSILEHEKTFVDKSIDKSGLETEIQEEEKTKIITKYSFFASKINRDYIINSDELFKLNIPIN